MKKTYTKQREITTREAFELLAKNPEGVPNCRFELGKGTLNGAGRGYFIDEMENRRYSCAILEEVDPRKVPKGEAPMPHPYLAFLGRGPIACAPPDPNPAIWACSVGRKWTDSQGIGYSGASPLNYYAIDVRTDWAKKHYPEICACYDPSEWGEGAKKEEYDQSFVDLIKSVLKDMKDKGEL